MTDRRSPSEQGSPAWGFIYVLTNPYMADCVKVGQTERHPELRALELSEHSGVPAPFNVEVFFNVKDPVAAEAKVHEALSYHRVSTDREFFRVSPETASQTIEQTIKSHIRGRFSAPAYREVEEDD